MTRAPSTGHLTRAEQARQTKENILGTALRLFAERGYDATSLQDIADEIGLTKAAVYYHYRSKSAILQALADPVYEVMRAAYQRAAGLRSRRQRVQALTSDYIDMLLAHREMVRVLANDPVMRGHMKAARSMDDLLADCLRLLFGEQPTIDQRLALHTAACLSEAVAAMPDVPDDELRPALDRAMRRLLPG